MNASSGITVHVHDSELPVPATVIAVDECTDVAVLSIDGNDHEYLDWYDQTIESGLAVFSAGYPNGDPTYELQGGEVVKVWPFGHFSWASMDSSVQHTAQLSPGGSGGPIVSQDGSVVAMSLAFRSGVDDMYFGVEASLVQASAEQLLGGLDMHAIGVNARVWRTGDSDVHGVWIESITAGSPAAMASLMSGDLIIEIGGVSLTSDPSLRTYCDVLHDAAKGRPIALEVVRPSTGQLLRGALHGDALAPIEDIDTSSLPLRLEAGCPDEQQYEGSERADFVHCARIPELFEAVPAET